MAIPVPTDTYPFVTPQLLRLRHGHFDPNIFTRWQRQGKVEKIRNGLYLDTRFEIRGDVDRFLIANQLYAPSYVSLWSAFRYYNFIPEGVFVTTSVGTRKTKRFTENQRQFWYQQIRPDYFFGYEIVPWRGTSYAIAYPEKALLDMAYLEPLFDSKDWLEELRLDEFELADLIDSKRLETYLQIMASPTVDRRIDLLFTTYAL